MLVRDDFHLWRGAGTPFEDGVPCLFVDALSPFFLAGFSSASVLSKPSLPAPSSLLISIVSEMVPEWKSCSRTSPGCSPRLFYRWDAFTQHWSLHTHRLLNSSYQPSVYHRFSIIPDRFPTSFPAALAFLICSSSSLTSGSPSPLPVIDSNANMYVNSFRRCSYLLLTDSGLCLPLNFCSDTYMCFVSANNCLLNFILTFL